MIETLILTYSDIFNLDMKMQDVMKIVEDVYRAHGLGDYVLPPKVALHPKENSFFHSMPGYLPKMGAIGIKWVSGYPENRRKTLPTIIGTIIINDPETGLPLAIMDGTWITNMRTGAVTGVGAKYLAKKDSEVIGIIGAGVQGRCNLLALNESLKIRKVKVYDISKESMKRYAEEMEKKLGLDIEIVERTEDAVKDSDVVVTTTSGTSEQLVDTKWLKLGVFGAPVEGEPVWDRRTPYVVDKFIVDNWEQCTHGGQFYSEIVKGNLTREKVYAELGEVVAGRKRGRESNEERIILWARGMGTLDIAIALEVYRRASSRNLGFRVKFSQ